MPGIPLVLCCLRALRSLLFKSVFRAPRSIKNYQTNPFRNSHFRLQTKGISRVAPKTRMKNEPIFDLGTPARLDPSRRFKSKQPQRFSLFGNANRWANLGVSL